MRIGRMPTSDNSNGGKLAGAKPLHNVRRSRMRAIALFTVGFVAAAVLAAGAGFLWFIWRVPTEEVRLESSADGIVVLTGGASRIADGMELLASGRGSRLLISG